VVFDPLVPYGMSDGTMGTCGSQFPTPAGYPLGYYWITSSNDGYSKAPVNNQNFIGWTNYFNAINAVLQKARGVVNVYGLEISQELSPGTFTAQARYFYDNSSPGTAPPQYVQGSYVNVLGALRSLMSSNSFDPGRVFYSAQWDDATTVAENCANAYGDYARATDLDEITQTINGGPIGVSSGMTVTNRLLCGGSPPTGTITSPIYSSQPDIVDVHVYPQVAETINTDAMIQQVAAIDYGDIPHFLSAAGLTSAAVVIGETWGGTLNPLYLGAANGGYCWLNDYQFPSGTPNDNVAGFNSEGVSNPLSAYTVTFRPWMNLQWITGACFNYGSGPGSSNNYQSINYNGQGPYTPTHQ
jgi:hypothetical protein